MSFDHGSPPGRFVNSYSLSLREDDWTPLTAKQFVIVVLAVQFSPSITEYPIVSASP